MYDDPIRNSTMNQAYSLRSLSKGVTKSQSKKPTPEEPESADSRQRRLLELRLMHQWATKTAMTFPATVDQDYKNKMTISMADLAFEHDAFLYSLCSFSALHIAKTATEIVQRENAMDAYSKYLDMALREHQIDIANLSKANADAVCVASSLIRNGTMATLADRPLDPYVPPTDWFHMMLGSREVFVAAWAWIGDDESSIARVITQRKPDMSDADSLFQESNGESFIHLLQRSPEDEATEPWNDEIQKTYRMVICYIGGIQIAMNANETVDELTRRAVGFPMTIPKEFIGLLENPQPRALVILAHYFALLSKLRKIWWIGDTGRREVKAIYAILSIEWQRMMAGPLLAIEETPLTIEPVSLWS